MNPSERPTPETDSAACELFCRFHQGGTYNAESSPTPQGEWVMAEFARSLERERDEAIHDLESGFMAGTYARLKQLQDEAVKRGVAEWAINPDNGETTFQWKDIKP